MAEPFVYKVTSTPGSGTSPVSGFRIALAAFAVIHVGLHWAFRRHTAYEFDILSSWLLIALAGALGGSYLLASLL